LPYRIGLSCGVAVTAGLLLLAADPPAQAASCTNPNAIGVSRTLVVDPAEHTRLGAMQYRESLPLGDHEVVLTFDDGPLPPHSTRILEALAAECTKATYFMVGTMARAYPSMVARIAAEGHTIGTHSQSHPFTFHRMPLTRAKGEIQGGIASVTAALGGRPPAPFFRIPGLLRASPVERYLATRNTMIWSADIASDDWRRIPDHEIVRRTLSRLEERGRGIILMHDIHAATASAVPTLLRELKARGYRVVHVVPATSYRTKTATLPSQWLAHMGSAQPPRPETRQFTVAQAATGMPRVAARAYEARKRQPTVRRRERAHVAIVVENNDEPGVDPRSEPSSRPPAEPPPSLLSGLLALPGRLLQ
jgi:peptidoglycan/xylan/chitin deacetylase (PgdA/CDA1 family)